MTKNADDLSLSSFINSTLELIVNILSRIYEQSPSESLELMPLDPRDADREQSNLVGYNFCLRYPESKVTWISSKQGEFSFNAVVDFSSIWRHYKHLTHCINAIGM